MSPTLVVEIEDVDTAQSAVLDAAEAVVENAFAAPGAAPASARLPEPGTVFAAT